MSKPSIPKGTRDFGPKAMVRRQWMFDTLRRVFKAHGFLPIQTPSFENLSTLTGKYGEEGDQLIFKILNNGDYLAKVGEDVLSSRESKSLTPLISKKALRYDLTVPFARFVVMNRNELSFPFKRYQIQTVWRGDRPGKGRYQEFTQCDCDIIGSESVMCELELVQILSEGLTALHVPSFRIHMNDRRLLQTLASMGGVAEEHFAEWTVAVDKIDKVGVEGVIRELEERGLPQSASAHLPELIEFRKHTNPIAALEALLPMVQEKEDGMEAWTSLKRLVEQALKTGVKMEALRVDPLLARGLDYYTGTIFEVLVDDAPVGSICGGGRYDDLTGIFGWPGMSGVGVSFGADRIEDVLNHFEAWPAMSEEGLDAMVVQMAGGDFSQELHLTQDLREAGLSVELYPDPVKLKKQFKYANDRSVRWVLVLGENELATDTVVLKDMRQGIQEVKSIAEAIQKIQDSVSF